jgi:hypothetical protein
MTNTKLKTITQEELDKVLSDHKTWLDSHGDKGTRADLSLTDLSKFDLSGSDLSMTNLSGSDLSDSNLEMAFLTYSGKVIDPFNIKEEDICFIDIAHHLSKICRYGGALPHNINYSVAQHSLHLVEWARENNYSTSLQKQLLLHDAAETYIGDMISSVKKGLNDYKKLEYKIEMIIKKKYSIIDCKEDINLIKLLDKRIVLDEARAFFQSYYTIFSSRSGGLTPLGLNIMISDPKIIEQQFLREGFLLLDNIY